MRNVDHILLKKKRNFMTLATVSIFKKSFVQFPLHFFLCILTNLGNIVYSQNECKSELLHDIRMERDSAYRSQQTKLELEVLRLTQLQNGLLTTSDSRQTPFVIPVVVHVIHLGEPLGLGSNIPDDQISQAIDALNYRWGGTNGLSVDMQVQFRLASLDPDGCITSGIVRVDGSSIQNYKEDGIEWDNLGMGAKVYDIKDLSRWTTLDYYNIWVVHKIWPGGVSGYASYPDGSRYDGTVIRASSMNADSYVLSHELGHAFNLAHTFRGDDLGCPSDTNCYGSGDLVCDTPPHRSSDCGDFNPCSADGEWENSRNNIMSYCPSPYRFTAGQKTRVHNTISLYPRANLLASRAFIAPDLGATLSAKSSCENLCLGSVEVNLQCPSDYTFEWNTGETSQRLDNLCAGTYFVTITVINTDLKVILSAEVHENIDPNSLVMDVSCLGGSDGGILLYPSNGSPYYCGPTFSIVPDSEETVNNTQFNPTPYGRNSKGTKAQYYWSQDELKAAGLDSGLIKSISFHVQSSSDSITFKNFMISLGNTINPSVVWANDQLQVFGPSDVTIAEGWNTHFFDDPYYWDGQSNLLVQVCSYNGEFVPRIPVYVNNTYPLKTSNLVSTNSLGGCFGPYTSYVSSFDRPNVRFDVCRDSVYYEIGWEDGSIGNIIDSLESGNYTVTITDSRGCQEFASVTVEDGILPEVTFSMNITVDIESLPFELTGGNPLGGIYSGVGVVNGTFDPALAGIGDHTISYTVTDSAGCRNSAFSIIEVGLGTSRHEIHDMNSLLLYPNPATDRLFIECCKIPLTNYDIKCFDIMGKKALSEVTIKSYSNKCVEYDISNLNPGIYFFIISDKHSSFCQRIVVL